MISTLVMFRVLIPVVAVTYSVKVTVRASTGMNTVNITAGFCQYIYSFQCINLTIF